MTELAPSTTRRRAAIASRPRRAYACCARAICSCSGSLADAARQRHNPGRVVTYIVDRNVNYSNVCVTYCSFCAFYRPPGHEEAYVQTYEQIGAAARGARGRRRSAGAAAGRTPPRPRHRVVRGTAPATSASTSRRSTSTASRPPEITFFAETWGMDRTEILRRFVAAGLGLDPRRRRRDPGRPRAASRSPTRKATTDEWLGVMEDAHGLGLKTSATMMFGHVETLEERVEHLVRAARGAGSDRRVHGLHRLDVPGAAHEAREARAAHGRRARVPPHPGGFAADARQLPARAGLVGDAGSGDRAGVALVRRGRPRRHDDGGERRVRRRRELPDADREDRAPDPRRGLRAAPTDDLLRGPRSRRRCRRESGTDSSCRPSTRRRRWPTCASPPTWATSARRSCAANASTTTTACASTRTTTSSPSDASPTSSASRRHGDSVWYNVNRHINPTNVCFQACVFCAFGAKGNNPLAWEMTHEEVWERADACAAQGATEIHIVSGIHPQYDLAWYEACFRGLKERHPDIHLKTLTAVEVAYFAEQERLSHREVLERLRAAGMDSMPGGGAEIFHPDVRARDLRQQVRHAGVVRDPPHGARDGDRDERDHAVRPHRGGRAPRGPRAEAARAAGRDAAASRPSFRSPSTPRTPGSTTSPARPGGSSLQVMAVSRLLLDNVPHLKAYWIMLGPKLAQVALSFGADDLDGTVVEERIVHMAGATSPEEMTCRGPEAPDRGGRPRAPRARYALPRGRPDRGPRASHEHPEAPPQDPHRPRRRRRRSGRTTRSPSRA